MKKIGVSLIVLFALVFLGVFYLESWLTKRIPAIINSNPKRNYDLLFEDFKINILQKSVELNKIVLVPINDSLATKINGSLRSIQMLEVDFKKLIFNKKLEIGEIKLVEPSFRLIHRDRESNANESSKAFQKLFHDLISRGEIKNFILEKGSAEMFIDKDSLYRLGQFTDLNIIAHGIKTDSIISTKAIPFELESISTSLKNLKILTGINQEFQVKEANYNSGENSVSFKGISLKYSNQISGELAAAEQQKDLIEISVKEFKLSQIDTKSIIYGDWVIFAGNTTIDSLVLADWRDKNKPRPQEPIKPLFEGIVESIPIPLKLDTIKILNSTISYNEIPDGKAIPIVLNFQQINGDILNLISIDSLQNNGRLTVQVTSSLNGYAPVKMEIDVPYGNDTFELNASIGAFDLTSLNQVFRPLDKFQIESGKLKRLKVHMKANQRGSQNQINFDYENLRLKILNSDGSQKARNGILSSVANLMISKENLPGNKNYKISRDWAIRNPYRSPFNLIWISVKDGLVDIVPSGITSIFKNESKNQ